MIPTATMSGKCPQCGETIYITAAGSAGNAYRFSFHDADVTTDYCGCVLTDDEMEEARAEAQRRSQDGVAYSGGVR